MFDVQCSMFQMLGAIDWENNNKINIHLDRPSAAVRICLVFFVGSMKQLLSKGD